MSGARDAAMMQAFRHECGILCAILTGLMESTWHTLLILDPSPPAPTCIVQSWVIFINMRKRKGFALGANFSSATASIAVFGAHPRS